VAGEVARITVDRTSPEDIQQRQIIVSLGEGSRAQLMFGESMTREIAPGHHVLKVHNTLVRKTLKFDAGPGDHVRFLVANRASRWMFGFLVVMGVAPLYLTVERIDEPAASHP
jgi:hypothetical protein